MNVNDLLRPAWTGKGARSYYVLKVEGETLTVKRFNVNPRLCYGLEFATTLSQVEARWERNQKRQGVASAPRYEARWDSRAQWVHSDWNNYRYPEGANKV